MSTSFTQIMGCIALRIKTSELHEMRKEQNGRPDSIFKFLPEYVFIEKGQVPYRVAHAEEYLQFTGHGFDDREDEWLFFGVNYAGKLLEGEIEMMGFQDIINGLSDTNRKQMCEALSEGAVPYRKWHRTIPVEVNFIMRIFFHCYGLPGEEECETDIQLEGFLTSALAHTESVKIVPVNNHE